MNQFLKRFQRFNERMPTPMHYTVRGDELGFSWRPCQTCGHRAAGNRYSVAIMERLDSRQIRHVYNVAACDDCLVYLANNELPNEDCRCIYCTNEERQAALDTAGENEYYNLPGHWE